MGTPMTTQREALLDKVRALMAKTVGAGCTEEEALSALAKARAMMDAYEISDEELTLTKEEKAILRREPSGTKDHHRIKWFLIEAVSQFCGCRAWRDRDRTLVFCGLPSDAQFATWLLDTLAAFVQAELVDHLMGSVAEGRERKQVIAGFVLGCTERINQRLKELREQPTSSATPNAKALVVAQGAAVKAKMDELGITLRSCSSSCGAFDESSYGAGKAAGDRASFGRPVSGRNATLRLK
jgi:Protein of unknown function (DUF2786)